jgi:gliding motility-associated protein GldM
MAVKKNPLSPRQKMINLMYIVLLAMLALNVSNEVLKGFDIVGGSLRRSTDNAEEKNKVLYKNMEEHYKGNPAKTKEWYDRAMAVKGMSDSLCAYAQELSLAIAREADGRDGDPKNLKNKEDLEAAGHIMLAPNTGQGKILFDRINAYKKRILTFIDDPREAAIIASNLSTDVPQTPDNVGKKWEQYMFESMPAIAAITMLTKLQNDVRAAEGEVIHSLLSRIDIKDIRVNELNAYVLPEATTLCPGDEFRSRIFMAAIDTTQRPTIYVNGRKVAPDGNYNFRVGDPGEYSFSGYIEMLNSAGDLIRRNFEQKYKVIGAPLVSPTHPDKVVPTGATVAADLMNVLYAGFDNPISVSASGISADKVSLSMTGGTLVSKGPGKYVARPAAVGQNVTFTVTGVYQGKTITMGTFTFRVRKLPDPTAYVIVGHDRFRGGGLSKGSAIGSSGIGAAIDDGLLDIPFKVLGFEAVFHDRMGNARPELSNSSNFTEAQRNLMREVRPGGRFYITRVKVLGPDGIHRTLPSAIEVIVR